MVEEICVGPNIMNTTDDAHKINLRRIYASYLGFDSETTKYDCCDTIWQDFVIPKVIPLDIK